MPSVDRAVRVLLAMSPDKELFVLFGGIHLVALAFVVLFMMFLRSDTMTPWWPPEDDEGGGGGGNDRLPSTPKPRPTGGIPLPDAEQAQARLRGHEKLRDTRPRPLRRPAETPPGRAGAGALPALISRAPRGRSAARSPAAPRHRR